MAIHSPVDNESETSLRRFVEDRESEGSASRGERQGVLVLQPPSSPRRRKPSPSASAYLHNGCPDLAIRVRRHSSAAIAADVDQGRAAFAAAFKNVNGTLEGGLKAAERVAAVVTLRGPDEFRVVSGKFYRTEF
jgi:hypothetical protein